MCYTFQVEDTEFESALEKMLLDNMSERQKEGRPTQRDISVPVHCRQQTKKIYEQLLVSISLFYTLAKFGYLLDEFTMNNNVNTFMLQQGNDSVEFVLMVRKGTKQLYKSFDAPAELATNLKQQAMADRLEMERVKK